MSSTTDPIPETKPGSDWEYTQNTCDIWELHHMSNYMAEYGWEPVFAVESHPGVQLPERISDENGPVRKGRPLRPYTTLFRRPLPRDEAEVDYNPDDEARAAIEAACTCPGCMTGGRCVEDPPEDDEDRPCTFCSDDCPICLETQNCDCPTHGGDHAS